MAGSREKFGVDARDLFRRDLRLAIIGEQAIDLLFDVGQLRIAESGDEFQVRDAFHPQDLAALIASQTRRDPPPEPIYNAGGGPRNAMSLAQLTAWCDERFGRHQPESDLQPRPFDAPWLVMDCARLAREFGWQPNRSLLSILDEIAQHVRTHPDWLGRCGVL